MEATGCSSQWRAQLGPRLRIWWQTDRVPTRAGEEVDPAVGSGGSRSEQEAAASGGQGTSSGWSSRLRWEVTGGREVVSTGVDQPSRSGGGDGSRAEQPGRGGRCSSGPRKTRPALKGRGPTLAARSRGSAARASLRRAGGGGGRLGLLEAGPTLRQQGGEGRRAGAWSERRSQGSCGGRPDLVAWRKKPGQVLVLGSFAFGGENKEAENKKGKGGSKAAGRPRRSSA